MIFRSQKKQNDQRNTYKEQVWDYVKYLNQGKRNYLASVYQALGSNDEEIVQSPIGQLFFLAGNRNYGYNRINQRDWRCSHVTVHAEIDTTVCIRCSRDIWPTPATDHFIWIICEGRL